jgi:hypothetical protein
MVPTEQYSCFHSERSMDLVLALEQIPSSGLVWSGVSGRQLGTLEPGASIHLPLCMVPLASGLQVYIALVIIQTVLSL